MAVQRSPFSNPTPPTPPTTQPRRMGRLLPTDGTKFDTAGPVSGTPESNSKGMKTSVYEERGKLDNAYFTALGKIANANVPERTKEQLRRTLEVKYKQGGYTKPTDLREATSFKGLVKAGVKTAFAPVQGLLAASSVVSRTAQSAVKEIGDLTYQVFDAGDATRNPNAPKASWKDFVNQAKDKDFRVVNTGVKWLDATIDFVADAAFDPLSYTGVGALNYVGKAGRMSLAAKLGTSEMLAKHPQLVGKLDDIMRYGVGAVPKEVRAAENIGYGVRFAGKVIPHTEAIAAVASGKKYSLGTAMRAATGDIIAKSAKLTNTRTMLTPSSRVGLVVKNVGRNRGLSDTEVLEEVAHWTASKFAKGFKAESYNGNLWKIRDNIKALRELPDADQAIIYDLVENTDKAIPAHLKQIVETFRSWQNELRDGVNSVYRRFNTDFNGSINDIAFVDDFVHHKITPEALQWIYSKNGGQNWRFRNYFNDMDMSPAELGKNTGAALHRKIRAPEVQPDGTVVYSKFMGQEVKSKSVIKEVNDIFRRETGLNVDFFSTDMASIADSYAYSMANARGREAYFRRLLDFGGDLSKVITTKAVPDMELVASLQKTHNGLMSTRKKLVNAITRGRVTAGAKVERATKVVQDLLDDKAKATVANDGLIRQVEGAVADMERELATVLSKAATVATEKRGAFYDLHKTLFDEVQQMKAMIASGNAVEMATVFRLQQLYREIYPNAKRIPKSATKLMDAINRADGIPDTVGYKELTKRLNALRKQLDSIPEMDPNDLNELLEVEGQLLKQIEGHEVLGTVRLDADYAEDGLLFGSWDDLAERQFDPTYEGAPYRVLSTRPVVPASRDMTVDEMAAARRAFMDDPNSVAVHAPKSTDVHDMREPDAFYDFWDGDEQGVAEGVALAMERAGLDGSTFRETWLDAVDTGVVDPQLEEVFPEFAQFMSFIVTMQDAPFELGIVDDQYLIQSFDTFRDLLVDIAAARGLENSDMVAAQMFDDVLGYMAEQVTNGPLLLPSSVIMGVDNPMAEGAYSLIVPENWSYSRQYPKENLVGRESSPVNFVKDNEFVRAIMDEDFHTAALDSSERLAKVTEATSQAGLNNLQRQAIRGELSAAEQASARASVKGNLNRQDAGMAWERFQSSGKIEVTVGGKPRVVSREEALDILTAKEARLNSKIANLEERIARSQGRATGQIEQRIQGQRERLATLMNKKKVLERWSDETGAYLRQELDDFRTVIAMEPPVGALGSETRQWSDMVLKRMESIKKLGGTKEHKAMDSVFTQLHADEAQLAYTEAFLQQSKEMITEAELGRFLPKIIDDIQDGWRVIEGMGIQMPPDMAEKLLPNVNKLRQRAEMNAFKRAFMDYQNAFKVYATMSLGFGVRNALSATFMNTVAGVGFDEMGRGIKAAAAYHKHGPVKWLDELGITDATERALYEEAFRAVHATGRGVMDDFMSPTVKGVQEKILNNKATRAFGRINSFVEDSVRLPMALDTLRKGGSYDDAVYRISRYHFDYSDLSQIDETTKRYFVPFWIWTTRNIPLQLTEQVLRPSTYVNYERLRERNPVSEDIIMPKWLAETGPLGLGGNWVLNPDLPNNRLLSTAESLVNPKRLIGQMNPLIKVPLEMIADKRLAQDIPFTDKFQEARGMDKLLAELGRLGLPTGRENAEGVMEVSPKWAYAAGSLLPPVSMIQRLTGGVLGGSDSYDERQLSSMLSWLGVPARQVGARQERGELIGRQFDIADFLKGLAQRGVIESNGG